MSYQKLKSIEIKGYKSIRDQKIPLSDLNVLIGQNGAGKTNFISVFKFLRNIIGGRLKNISLRTGAENLMYYGSKETQQIIINLNFDPNYYSIYLQPTQNKDTLIVESEFTGIRRDQKSTDPYWELIASSEEESLLELKANIDSTAQYVYNALNEWRVYHFHDTTDSAGVKKYASLASNGFLFEDASNLAPFLYLLKRIDREHYERIVKTVQLVIPFFKDFKLEPNPLNQELIRLEWNDVHSDKTFTANELSDGSLRFICMATLLLQNNLPKVILLDEPELGLHPTAITILAGLLKKASKRSQVIVSTQSVSLVNEFDAEDIIVVENKNSETEFNRLDSTHLEDWLNDYSMGDLWDKNIFGGRP
jgi:predicted ATPase